MKKTLLFIAAAVILALSIVLILNRTVLYTKDTTVEPLTAPDSGPPQPADTPAIEFSAPEELISQLIASFAEADGAITDEASALLDRFTETDPLDASRWRELIRYWDFVNNRMTVNAAPCETDLPDDSSLCIVVLGYQLEEDGGMRPELLKRLETALRCAEQYPNAYVAVTGGGTARLAPETSEAGSMAAWLIEHGVSSERIIIESSSLTTAQNAVFTDSIFKTAYPEIRSLIIVTSDYHIRRGCMVFETEAILTDSPIRVVSNVGCDTGRPGRDPVRIQEYDIMQVAEYYYDFHRYESAQGNTF